MRELFLLGFIMHNSFYRISLKNTSLRWYKRAFLSDLMWHTEVVVAMAPKSYDMDEMQSHK